MPTLSQRLQSQEIRKYCECGTLIWAGGLPGYLEQVICLTCKTDHSRKLPLLLRLRYGRSQLRRWWKIFWRYPCIHCTTNWCTSAQAPCPRYIISWLFFRVDFTPLGFHQAFRLSCIFRDGRTPKSAFLLPRERGR